MEKRTRSILISVAAAIALIGIILVSVLVPLLSSVKDAIGNYKPLDLPIEEQYALARYDYDSLKDAQVTLRADAFNVTKRNLPRAKTTLLSDTYTVTSNTLNGTYSESIEFTSYPGESDALTQNELQTAAIAYGLENGIDTSTESGLALAKSAYFSFYKYMLASQGDSLIKSYQAASANFTLNQSNIFKHPAADMQYGAVDGTDNAVEKVITLDSSYRSYHVTGLYLPAGEAVTVKADGLKDNEYISIVIALNDSMGWRGDSTGETARSIIADMGGTYSNNYFKDSDLVASSGRFYETYDASISKSPLVSAQWYRQNKRLPRLTMNFTVYGGKTYTIGSPFGGIMHIGLGNCYSNADVTISGAVETPHYILGVTTPEYFDEYLRDAPGVMSALDTENGQLIGKASYMRNVATDEIDKLATLWHSFYAVNESFSGGTYNRNNIVKFDTHVPAGAAVALGGMVYACPTSWYGSAMNYRGLINNGSWGILHEIGHSHASSYGTVWGFAGNMEGEVRNNALIALSYIMFLDIGTTRNVTTGNISAEHGFVAHPYSNLKNTIAAKNKSLADFNNYDYFEALTMYVNLMHSFGADKFYELLYSYKAVSSFAIEGATNAKRADFIYRCATVYGMDFRRYFNDLYSANVPDSSFSEEQLSEMRGYPVYEPIASLYAGGIDGVKTGGDYRINALEPTTFDFAANTLCLKEFEITSVGKPTHGTLQKIGDEYTYTPNSSYFGTHDEFTYSVKIADGTSHTFTVSLRLTYNGATLEDYGTVPSSSLDEVNLDAEHTTTVTNIAGVPSYNNNTRGNELKTSAFYYIASRTGEHQFSVKGDDKIDLYFGTSESELNRVVRMDSYNNAYADARSFTTSLTSGTVYMFKIVNLNAGGQGSARLGLKRTNGNYSDVELSSIFPSSFNTENVSNITPYAHEPNYIISKKDNVIVGSLSTDKSTWSVVEAPENIQGGRYETETFYDENDPSVIVGTRTIDKRDYLIDGQSGTLFHTTWSGSDIRPPTDDAPDVFVIDTAKIQPFNYFQIQTRDSANALIQKYKLEISDDNITYKTVSEGDELSYTKATARIEFTQTTGRYWKLSVMKTSGTRFTIIGELSCGSSAKTQLIIPSTSSKIFLTSDWTETKNISGATPGMITTSSRNSKAVIKFIGSNFALYSATGNDFGRAKVIIDGETVGEINLNGETKLKQLAFNYENLNNKEHTVEIITLDDKPFNLAFAGLSYTSTLLNAPDIYTERALTVALIVVSILLALAIAFVLILVFCPKVRNLIFKTKPTSRGNSDTADNSTQEKPSSKPSATKSTPTSSKPTSASSTTKSTSGSSTTKPTSASSTTKPTSGSPTTKSTSGSSTAKPTSASSTTKPTSKRGKK